MLIQDFNYPLPETRIAKYPLTERDASKLLLYRDGVVQEDTFVHIADYLKEGSLLVMNNTRVIRARLHFRKPSGARIEVFCLEPHSPHDYQQNFAAQQSCEWICLVGNAKKWKEGEIATTLTIQEQDVTLTAEKTMSGEANTRGEYVIRFSWSNPALTFAEVLEACGELPIPPYLNRETEESDLTTYQTVYARIKGSVAAPTAGLHFTERVFQQLEAKGITRAEVTLHVGAGTFRPVKTAEVEQHEMHAEWISIERDVIAQLIQHGGQCIAVGTTTVRTLETLYYIGVMLLQQPATDIHHLHVTQWQPYETDAEISTTDALQAVVDAMDKEGEYVLHATTQIMIKPGYRYHVVKTMITNFHQPQSTLLLLVSAFVDGNWRTIYDYALQHDFRFLSYGDSCLLNY